MVSVASSDVCSGVLPFRLISPFSVGGGAGETEYLITSLGSSKNITFTCVGNAVTLLADALQSQSSPILGLDGIGTRQSWRWTSQGPAESLLLATTMRNDVIILIGEGPVSVITDSSGLNFTQRIAYSGIGGSASLFEYYARATSPLRSDNITIVLPYSLALAPEFLALWFSPFMVLTRGRYSTRTPLYLQPCPALDFPPVHPQFRLLP